MDLGEEKCLANIEKYGCHIIHVMAEDDLPPFSYSVGIQKSSGAPEVVVFGLKQPVAGWVINEYNRRVREQGSLALSQLHSGFLEGFDCQLQRVHRRHYEEHFGWNLWLYQGPDFEVVQLVYPTTRGVWPWAEDAPEGFRQWQPLLTEKGWPDASDVDVGGVWLFDQPPNCASVVSRAVLEHAAPILCVSHDEDDHGWQFLHTAEPVDDVEELVLVHLGHVLELDPSVQELADLEPGWIATRASHGAAWVREPCPADET